MITVLSFHNGDRDLALKLLKWMGQLGGTEGHSLVLQSNKHSVRSGICDELVAEAKKHFEKVENFTPFTEDERGWPMSPNHAWQEAVIHMREKFASIPQGSVTPGWLWLEPDCVPLHANWLNDIEAEYKDKGKPFMAAEVLRPIRRLSGIAVYPSMVVSYLRHRRLSDLTKRSDKGEAWDQYYSPEWMEFTHFTKLIQNMHWQSRDPEVAPTFPTQESLSILDPRAAMFHRCKDGTLIDRLREKMAISTPAIEVKSVEIHNAGIGATASPSFHPAISPESIDQEPSEIELLRAKVKEMEEKLSTKIEYANRPKRGRKPRERTLEQIAADKDRMQRVREAREAKKNQGITA